MHVDVHTHIPIRSVNCIVDLLEGDSISFPMLQSYRLRAKVYSIHLSVLILYYNRIVCT